ncbi:hypothetical protein Tco_1135205 [Tanacetum coccineum]
MADSSVVPTKDPVSSAEDTKAFETDESAPTPYASAPTPPSLPPSPITPLSSPLAQIPSPPLPLPSPPTTSPTYVEAPLGNRAAEIRLRAALPSTHHPSEIPLPPLLLPTTTHRDDLLEANMPLRKRGRFTTPTYRFKVGESSSAAAARQAGQTLAHRVDYGFIDTMEASIHASESRVMTVMRALIAEYASAPTPPSPPPSPLSPLSSPLPQIPSPSLPLPSSPTTSPTYVEAPLGYRAAGIRLRVASLSTHHPLKIELPPLLLPSTSHIDDTPEADMLLRKRARFTTLTSGFKVGESSAAAGARQPAMEAQIRALQRDVDVLQRQRIGDEDRLIAYIQHEHDRFRDLVRVVEAGPQDGPEDVGSYC